MVKLKTLKDINWNLNKGNVDEMLRKEAIEHLNALHEETELMRKEFDINNHLDFYSRIKINVGNIKWIKYFFNISDEEYNKLWK